MYTTLFYTYTLVPLRSLTPSFPWFVSPPPTPPPPPRPRLTDILYYGPTGQFARSLNLFLTSPLSNTHSLSLDNSCSIPVHTSLSACDHTHHRRGTGPLPWLPSYNGWQIPATLLIFLLLLRRQPAVFVKKIMVKSSDFPFLCFCSGNNG